MSEAENKPDGAHPPLLFRSKPSPCPYLGDRQAQEEFMPLSRLDGAVYQVLMDAGFRRSGQAVYRPSCGQCRECVPLRVPVTPFSPSRSQRRAERRNADIVVQIDLPACTEEKWRIYADYLKYQHDGAMDGSFTAFEEFLYNSPTETLEMTYRLDRQIVAVGIVDVCPDCLSSVYFYFDPAHARRSLGVFGALCEIQECRRRGLAYWYAGFYVRQCPRMNYKAQFQPYELLGDDRIWHPPPESG